MQYPQQKVVGGTPTLEPQVVPRLLNALYHKASFKSFILAPLLKRARWTCVNPKRQTLATRKTELSARHAAKGSARIHTTP